MVCYEVNWCQDQQSGIRNMMISNCTNCLLYGVSGFSIPSWFTCWVCERPAALSDTFQRAEDLEATGVLTSSLQDPHMWTVLTTNKLLVFVCEPWCSLINFLYFVGKLGETYIFVGKFHICGRETVYPYNLTPDDLHLTLRDSSTLLRLAPLDQCLEGLENQTLTWSKQTILPLSDDGGKRESWIWGFPRLASFLLPTLQPYIP